MELCVVGSDEGMPCNLLLNYRSGKVSRMKPQYSDTTLYTTTGLEVRWARVVIQRGLLSFLFKQKFNFSMRNTVAVPCIASAVNDETVRVTAESFIV